MRKNLVITVTGNDKVGLVEEITRLILDYKGNVDSSRMIRLGGEFTMLLLVSVQDEQFDALREGVRSLREAGFKVATRETVTGYSRKFATWSSWQIRVNGADHEGIIHEITRHLSQKGISIELMDTGMQQMATSGGALFTMTATVVVPPELVMDELSDDLKSVGDKLNVDIEISPYADN